MLTNVNAYSHWCHVLLGRKHSAYLVRTKAKNEVNSHMHNLQWLCSSARHAEKGSSAHRDALADVHIWHCADITDRQRGLCQADELL